MNVPEALHTVQQEIALALATVEEEEIEALVDALASAPRIFVTGMGRVGLVARSFAMRLMHLGLQAHWIGEATAPALSPGDLLLACSGSGETAPVRVFAELALQRGGVVATITRQPQAAIGRLAAITVGLMAPQCPGDLAPPSVPPSAQPMTTLFEQSLGLLLDAVVLLLMERLAQTEATMGNRHFNLERWLT